MAFLSDVSDFNVVTKQSCIMNYSIVGIKAFLICIFLIAGGCGDRVQGPRRIEKSEWRFETYRTDYKPRNVAKIVKPSYVSDADLQKINKVAVLVTSTDPLFGRIVEDQLSVSLRDRGFDVVAPLRIYERTLGELRRGELIRLREQLKLEGKTRADQEDTDRDDAHVIAAGKGLGLDALIMGEVDEERRPVSFDKRSTPTTVEKLMVLAFNVQVIDIRTERNVLSVTLTYDEEENIISVVDNMVQFITDEIGP